MCSQGVHLGRASLGILLCATDTRHYGEMSTCSLGLTSHLLKRWKKFAHGVRMAAVAKNYIKDNNGCCGVLPGSQNAFPA